MVKLRLILGVLLLFSLIGSSVTATQAVKLFPARPLTLICPWAAGGGSDRIAQKVAELLGKELKQKINIVNRIGGGGVIGFTTGATAEPNGYTLML